METFLFISGVILFASDQEVAELMNAVKRIGATGKFSWIGSDGWSARALVSEGIFNNSISCNRRFTKGGFRGNESLILCLWIV